jgi:hypothetical protein
MQQEPKLCDFTSWFPIVEILGYISTMQAGSSFHKLSPWSTILLQKLIVTQIVKKFPEFYWTWMFITASTRTPNCPYHDRDQSSSRPHPSFWRSILKSPSHLGLGLPSGLSFRSPNNLYAPHLSPIRATGPDHLILINLITKIIFGEEHTS